MKISNCDFDTWSKKHSPLHKDKIYREVYPFYVFSRIDFDKSKIKVEQVIDSYYSTYYVEILNIEKQDDGRFRATFYLNNTARSKRSQWHHRTWNELFRIVYSEKFEMITVFARNEDSSKEYVRQFFKGDFTKITYNKSLPISELLIRSLTTTLCSDLFGYGNYYSNFKISLNGYRDLPLTGDLILNEKSFYPPIFSQGRKLWVCYAFNEEKAHRIGFYNGNQCDKLYVVFCNPTYTRHHRCKYPEVYVVSLFEFAHNISREVARKYENQIRFLQRHLFEEKEYSIDYLENEIKYPTKEVYEIGKELIMESLAIMKIVPQDKSDLFHFLTAMNLLNAFTNRNKKNNVNNERFFKDMYYFKQYLSKVLIFLITEENFESRIYLEPNLAMIELNNFQFSFHHIPLDEPLIQYMHSERNKKIEWSGKKLQPIAPLILEYSKIKRRLGS